LLVSPIFYGVPVNKINPKKLLRTKWTALMPANKMPTDKEKHFMVTEVEFDEDGIVVSCSIEAVMSKRSIPINWHDLKDDNNWVHGWK
jgi:tryptophan-rich hypothetical protein